MSWRKEERRLDGGQRTEANILQIRAATNEYSGRYCLGTVYDDIDNSMIIMKINRIKMVLMKTG